MTPAGVKNRHSPIEPERYLGEGSMPGAWFGVPLKFECRRGELLWEVDALGAPCFKMVDPKREPEALDRFIRLAEPKNRDRDIEEFVGLFGPLWLCAKHELPRDHPLFPNSRFASWDIYCQPDLRAKFRTDKELLGWRDFHCEPRKVELNPSHRTRFKYSEAVAAWRRLAVRAHLLLKAAEGLRSGRPPSPQFWKQIDGGFGDEPLPEILARQPVLTDPWYRLTDNVNWWLELGNVKPYLGHKNRAFQVCWRQDSAFALIGVQLMLAINRAENFGYLICAGCGEAKPRSRPPLAGKRVGLVIAQRDYCDDCRQKGIPVRDAKRDQRRRDKIIGLHHAGRSINQIAAETGVEINQIKEITAKARRGT